MRAGFPAGLLVLLVLASGCSSAPPPLSTKSAEGSRLSSTLAAPSMLVFTACDEANLVYRIPAEQAPVPPQLSPKRDATGRFATLVLTFLSCRGLSDGRENLTEPTALFALVPVEPLAKVPLPGALGIYYLASVVSGVDRVERPFLGLVADTDNDSVEVGFLPNGPWAKGQAAAIVKRGDRILLEATTAILGPLQTGSSGELGLYMSKDGQLTTGRVSFGNYTYYANGAASTRDADGNPGPLARPGHVLVNANHNLGYEATFRLNRTATAWR